MEGTLAVAGRAGSRPTEEVVGGLTVEVGGNAEQCADARLLDFLQAHQRLEVPMPGMPSTVIRALETVRLDLRVDDDPWVVEDLPARAQHTQLKLVVFDRAKEPVLAELEVRGWALGQIWNTHWHPDHTGGNLELREATSATISGPDSDRIPGSSVILKEGSEVRIGQHVGRVVEVPGHTLDHIALIFDEAGVVFVGDTLFAMGCGRLFEGTPEQMHRSLQRLIELPGATRLYCAHEYTLANARFAAHAEPENAAIAHRLSQVQILRNDRQITLPTTVAEERETNPFVRAGDVETFARLRSEKDSFR